MFARLGIAFRSDCLDSCAASEVGLETGVASLGGGDGGYVMQIVRARWVVTIHLLLDDETTTSATSLI